jgi:hypothetical protein
MQLRTGGAESFAEQEDVMRKVSMALTIAAGLAVMAAPAVAQIGTEVRERPAVQGRGMMGGAPGARVHNPASLLLERRAELGLTADQVRQIEAIQARVAQQNAARMEQVRAAMADRGMRSPRDVPAEEREQLRQQMRDRMEQLRPVRQQIRETNRSAGQEIHALLTDDQRQQLRAIRSERMRELRATRGERGDGEWQKQRGGQRDDAAGRRHLRGPRGGGV